VILCYNNNKKIKEFSLLFFTICKIFNFTNLSQLELDHNWDRHPNWIFIRSTWFAISATQDEKRIFCRFLKRCTEIATEMYFRSNWKRRSSERESVTLILEVPNFLFLYCVIRSVFFFVGIVMWNGFLFFLKISKFTVACLHLRINMEVFWATSR